ncbi:uncharacterized protein LOC124311399 [Daphnia pulicaria]|uniref:uncharacterized protein LOC124311399 n=1 Tax=Daphnia pulicaria TaxID=35523 RepID=UPI001EEC4A83|nr:uncharacterized protein LOC124311399 [Daphnia pulicaria]
MCKVPNSIKVLLLFGLILGQHMAEGALKKFKGKRRGGPPKHGLQLGGKKYKSGTHNSGTREYDSPSQVLAPQPLTAYSSSKLHLASVPIMPLPSPHYSRTGYEVWNAGTAGSEHGRAIWHGNNPRVYGHGTHAYGPPQVHLSPEDLIIRPEETSAWTRDGPAINRIIDGPPTGRPIQTVYGLESDSISPGGNNKVGKLLALAIAYSYGVPTLPKIKSLLEQDM